MRRSSGVTLAVVVAAGLAASPTGAVSGGARPRSCTPPHSKTIARDSRARVFRKYVKSEASWFVWGCAVDRETPWYLGYDDRGHGQVGEKVAPIRLNGPFAGYAVDDFYESPAPSHAVRVIARDLRTARVVHEWSAQLSAPCQDYHVRALVVNGRGSLGWLAAEPCDRGNAIFAADRSQRAARLLDEGPDVGPTLALHAGRLVWTKGGQRMSTRVR